MTLGSSNLIDFVQFLFENLIRSPVTQDLPGKVVTPGLDIGDLFCSKTVNPLSLGDESADDAIMPFY